MLCNINNIMHGNILSLECRHSKNIYTNFIAEKDIFLCNR